MAVSASDTTMVDREADSPDKVAGEVEKQSQISPSSTPAHQPPTVPDGGLRAWATLAGAWLVLFCTFGYVNAFGVYEAYYLATTGESASTISWIGSLQLFFQFSLGGIVGPLFDRGYFRSVTIFGSLLYVFALMMVSLGKTYWQFLLAQGVAAGIGVGIMFLPTMSVIAHHFQKRRALASGIVVSGSSLGGVLFPIMLNNLFNNGTGFAWGVRASAFLILGCLVLSQLLMRDRFAELGIHKKAKPDLKGIFKDPVFQCGTAGFFLILLGVFIGFFYVQVFAESQGLDPTFSFYTLAILNAASIFGRTLPNFLADKFGSFNMLTFCAAVTGLLCLLMPAASSTGGLVVWCLVYGFFSGAYISLLSPAIFTTARSPAEMGARLGMTFMILSIAGLTGTPIVGAILGDGDPRDYSWWSASVFAGVMVFAGACFVLAARMLMAKRKGSQKV